MKSSPLKILILCTGNSARSILAEALINKYGGKRFKGYSAGSHPVGKVNPVAIALLDSFGHPVDRLRSKSWDEFTSPDAPVIDAIITVCDNAAGEVCPVWPGNPVTAHWGMEDPAVFKGKFHEKLSVFEQVYRELERRIERLMDLPSVKLSPTQLKNSLEEIAK
ncbi:Arsenate reductase thioredoxin-coupled, LMWP family [hydrothermal vent metagenome]|uniref:Arsenate reductase thioredoxin-coupled, LMWP family n=1 Tax=hydrothermal vent metagenome TaxID=652676 RepID=A0A3B1CL42_9ZZZZ